MRIKRDRIICIVGPTAIGKTRLAISLARKIGAEIVSADSMQLYKGMTIISQAPGAAEKKRVKHHLVGCVDPRDDFNVAAFRLKATRAIRSICKRKKVPLIVGGSGLYIKALVDGLFPSPEADMAYRSKMQAYVTRYGSPRLHRKLEKIDPASAGRIHPHDSRRIIRALELFHATGKTMTELAAETTGLKDDYDIKIFGLNRPRHELYAAIDERVDRMVRAGAVKEVGRLARKRLSRNASAVLGYKEIRGYLDGEYDLAAAKALLQQNTRRFAKRQLSWFRGDKCIRWFDTSRTNEKRLVEAIRKDVWKKRSS